MLFYFNQDFSIHFSCLSYGSGIPKNICSKCIKIFKKNKNLVHDWISKLLIILKMLQLPLNTKLAKWFISIILTVYLMIYNLTENENNISSINMNNRVLKKSL